MSDPIFAKEAAALNVIRPVDVCENKETCTYMGSVDKSFEVKGWVVVFVVVVMDGGAVTVDIMTKKVVNVYGNCSSVEKVNTPEEIMEMR